MSCFRRVKKCPPRRGAALVEFAIVAPFLLLMLVGMIEFGRALILKQSLNAAARVGVREATLPGSTVASVKAAAEAIAGLATTAEVDVAVTPNLDTEEVNAGDTITVSVGAPISAITKMGSFWFGADFEVTADAAMRKEGYD